MWPQCPSVAKGWQETGETLSRRRRLPERDGERSRLAHPENQGAMCTTAATGVEPWRSTTVTVSPTLRAVAVTTCRPWRTFVLPV